MSPENRRKTRVSFRNFRISEFFRIFKFQNFLKFFKNLKFQKIAENWGEHAENEGVRRGEHAENEGVTGEQAENEGVTGERNWTVIEGSCNCIELYSKFLILEKFHNFLKFFKNLKF